MSFRSVPVPVLPVVPVLPADLRAASLLQGSALDDTYWPDGRKIAYRELPGLPADHTGAALLPDVLGADLSSLAAASAAGTVLGSDPSAGDLAATVWPVIGAAVEVVRLDDPDNLARGNAALSGLLQDVASRADAAALRVLPTMADNAAAAIWADVLELLAQDGLEAVIYCARSGRRLSDIDPRPWRDHLAVIHRLGVSRVADDALARLYTAVLYQVGQTVAPSLLVTSQEASAFLREFLTVDFVIAALSRVVPIVRGADANQSALFSAQRAQLLGKLRASAEMLSRPVLGYLAECLTLYLSNVAPGKVPREYSALGHYRAVGWAGALDSPASVSHLCNRLVLTLWQLIQSRKVLPVERLSVSDLRALRVHWSGLQEYQDLRAIRAVMLRPLARVGSTALGERIDARAASSWASSGGLSFDLADSLDLQSALRMTGRKVMLAVSDPVQHKALIQRRADIQRLAEGMLETGADDDGDTLGLDLSDLAMSGGLGDAFNSVPYESPLDLLGLDTDEELFALLYQQAGADDEAEQWADEQEEIEPDDGLVMLGGIDDDEGSDAIDLTDLGLGGFAFGANAAPLRRVPSFAEPGAQDRQAALLEAAIRDARPIARDAVPGLGFQRLRPKLR